MRRTAIRLAGIILVSAMLPALIWLAGATIGPAPELRPQPNQAARPTRSVSDIFLDAPITSSVGASGQGTLCLTDADVRITLQVGGLAPGEDYSAWMSSTEASDACSPWLGAAASGLGDLSGADPTGLMVRLGEEIASPAGELEVHAVLSGVRPTKGARISLLLLRPGGRAGPRAQSSFVIP